MVRSPGPGPVRLLAARAYGMRTRLRMLRQEGRADRSLLRWYPWWQVVDPYASLDLTSPWEQAWVARWLARERQGTGAVVELGTWLGATTRAMVCGVGAVPEGQAPVVFGYDAFVAIDLEARMAGTPLTGLCRDGTSFRPIFDRRIGRWADRIQVRQGDVLAARWDDGPIELLFVDLAKTWAIWRHVRAAFLPHLVVGGVLVEQDWAHANTPWLHLWHHRWRDHFEPLGNIIHSSSVPFRLVRPLPPEALAPDELADYDAAEVLAAFAWSADLVRPDKRANVAGAQVMLHALHGDHADGVAAALAAAADGQLGDELVSIALPELARRIVAAEA